MRPIVLFATVLCMGFGAALGMAAAVFLVSDWNGPDERLLLTVLREVREQYVEDVPRPQLVDNAIRGILAGLDDYSVFLDEQALVLMQEDTIGKFGDTSVHGRTLAPGYGYVKIDRFNTATVDDLHRAVDELRQHDVLSGLVVDLRDNPGGLLLPAVDVADAFLDDGLIVSIKGRGNGIDRRYEAQPGELLAGVPLAVLLNRDTASASEVVAGALQDHDRAIVIGTKSYGKGSVQSVMYFQNRRAIKLTTAHYYTPTGRSIQETGVTPDIDIASDDKENRAQYDARLLREAVAHLEVAAAASAKRDVVAAVGLEPTTPAL